MKKALLLTVLILITCITVKAQEEKPKVVKSLVSGYFLPLKIAYEHRIGDSYTAEISAGVTGLTEFNENEPSFSLVPVIRTDLKYFYNLGKRFEKGKNIAMNSGNFWGLAVRYAFEPVGGDVEKDPESWGSLFFAPMWGIQRNYKSHFSLGLNLGYGVGVSSNKAFFDPLINFRLGFVFYSGN